MATYENRYTLVAAPGKKVEGLTLYEACKALESIAAQGKLYDVTHVRRGQRCVAFFCKWDNVTTAMFGAHDDERRVLDMWRP